MSNKKQQTFPGRLLIVGGVGGTNVGDSLYRAGIKLGIETKIMDTRLAYLAPAWLRIINWHLLGRRPAHLRSFGKELLDVCQSFKPEAMISTGISPISESTLKKMGVMGVRLINYLTDDPWSQSHRSSWFIRALINYDMVFSTRRATLRDLSEVGCRHVHYLPFGYDEDLFFSPKKEMVVNDPLSTPDVVFAGGADADRVPYIDALIKNGLNLALYGSYWDRYPETRSITMGQASVDTLRQAIASAKVALCLVRRANRDGSCMRSFEVPAIGACMLTEDTQEHRELFGKEGEAVLYFKSIDEMTCKAKQLFNDNDLRSRLAVNAHRLIVEGGNTYRHRLIKMLEKKE